MIPYILHLVLAWAVGVPPFYAIVIPLFITGCVATLIAFEASQAGFNRDCDEIIERIRRASPANLTHEGN